MIRRPEASESELLTRLSFASKSYWQYPEAFFEVWSHELTITPDYIAKNDLFVYESERAVVGYYSILELDEDIDVAGITLNKGFWLEHMFVAPRSIGKGIGSQLFKHMKQRCQSKGIITLGVLADPNARGFYEKMGCTYVGEYPSTIKNRTTPYLILEL